MRRNTTKPTFLWQGILILLPVLVLAGVGIMFLRQDRQLALQDARQNSQSLLDQIANYVVPRIDSQLRAQATYAASDLHKTNQLWRKTISSESSGATLHYHVPEEPYRELQQLMRQSALLPDQPGPIVSTNGLLLYPPPYPVTPQPLPEASRMSTEQQDRLNAARTAAVRDDDATAEKLLLEILDSASQPMTESGLPLKPIAALELLRLRCETATASTNAHDIEAREQIAAAVALLGSNALAHASMITPALLDEALKLERNVIGSAEATHWQAQWRFAELDRAVYNRLSQLPSGNWPGPTAFWTMWNDQNWLVTVIPVHDGPPDNPGPLRGYQWRMDSEILIEMAILEMLDESKLRLPPYASIGFKLYGRPFPRERPGPRQFPFEVNGPWLDLGPAGYIDLLAKKKIDPRAFYTFTFTEKDFPQVTNATEVLARTETAWSVAGSSPTTNLNPVAVSLPGLQVELRLARPAVLFAMQQKRAMLFGGLIAISAMTACVGFVTARRAFHRQLRLNDLKSNFVSSVSHELRAPIASVRLMAEGLERDRITEPAKQKDYYKFIGQECRRLSSLIENVLDFSRIEQGRKQYEFEPTDIVKLVTDTVKVMEPYAAEKNVALALASSGVAEGFAANLDGRAIQQALINLIDNAIKHSPNGTQVRVGVEASTELRITVDDSGPGIPRDEHEKIFERFYRLGSELRRETQGIGIGLSILKHIVEAHHGCVRVESEPGKGSRFTIELPLEKT